MRGLRFILILVCSFFVLQTISANSVHACDLNELAQSDVASVGAKDHSDDSQEQNGSHHCICNCVHQPVCQNESLTVKGMTPVIKEVTGYALSGNPSTSIKGLFKPPRA